MSDGIILGDFATPLIGPVIDARFEFDCVVEGGEYGGSLGEFVAMDGGELGLHAWSCKQETNDGEVNNPFAHESPEG